VDGPIDFAGGWKMTDEQIADIRKKIAEKSQEISESKAHFKDMSKSGATLEPHKEDHAKLKQLEKDYKELLEQLTNAQVR